MLRITLLLVSIVTGVAFLFTPFAAVDILPLPVVIFRTFSSHYG